MSMEKEKTPNDFDLSKPEEFFKNTPTKIVSPIIKKAFTSEKKMKKFLEERQHDQSDPNSSLNLSNSSFNESNISSPAKQLQYLNITQDNTLSDENRKLRIFAEDLGEKLRISCEYGNSLISHIKSTEETKNMIKRKVKKLKHENTKLEQNIFEMRKEKNDLKVESISIKDRMKELEEKNAELERMCERYKDRNKKNVKKNEELKKVLVDWEKRIRDMEYKRELHEKIKKKMDERCSTLEKELKKRKKNFEIEKNEIFKKYEKIVQSTKSEVKNYKKELEKIMEGMSVDIKENVDSNVVNKAMKEIDSLNTSNDEVLCELETSLRNELKETQEKANKSNEYIEVDPKADFMYVSASLIKKMNDEISMVNNLKKENERLKRELMNANPEKYKYGNKRFCIDCVINEITNKNYDRIYNCRHCCVKFCGRCLKDEKNCSFKNWKSSPCEYRPQEKKDQVYFYIDKKKSNNENDIKVFVEFKGK